MSPTIFLYIIIYAMGFYILGDIIRRIRKKEKPEIAVQSKPDIKTRIVEDYGNDIMCWFKYGSLVFWAYSDSLNELSKSTQLRIKNNIIKNTADRIEQRIRESDGNYRNYSGKFNILVLIINNYEKSTVTWDFKFIATDGELLGNTEVSTKKLVEDINNLITDKEK